MSFVYLATDIATQAQFAIKVLSEALSQTPTPWRGCGARRRSACVSRIRTCATSCAWARRGSARLCSDAVRRREILADRNNRLGHIPLADTVKFVKDMAAGLAVAHELKIVHRDLKPENVMILPRARFDGVRRRDGLRSRERTQGGGEAAEADRYRNHPRTPEFMSPEQLRGKPLDRAPTSIRSR